MNKLKYLVRCILAIFQKKNCPYCGSTDLSLNQRKYLVTSLLKCNNCKLLHRHPKDSPEFLNRFYQSEYHIDVEMMTDLPSKKELVVLKKTNFPGLKDYFPFIEALAPSHNADFKMIDYGCSWGYNVFKLKQNGVNCAGYELSVPRANFGNEHLDVEIYTDESKIRKDNDIIFSSHVIEHLYAIQDFVALSRKLLKKDGIFIAFCPNGSKEYQKREPSRFRITWGSVHPTYPDIEFASHVFKDNPYMLLTSDWPYDLEKIKNWDGVSQYIDECREGYELLIIAKPNIKLN